MNGCVYRTEDNKCKFWSDHGKGIVSYCDPCDCEEKTVSNADRIRAMTDEELATFFGTLPCCPPGNADELCFPDNTCGADTKMMVKCWGTWLKAPVEEGDNG